MWELHIPVCIHYHFKSGCKGRGCFEWKQTGADHSTPMKCDDAQNILENMNIHGDGFLRNGFAAFTPSTADEVATPIERATITTEEATTTTEAGDSADEVFHLLGSSDGESGKAIATYALGSVGLVAVFSVALAVMRYQ